MRRMAHTVLAHSPYTGSEGKAACMCQNSAAKPVQWLEYIPHSVVGGSISLFDSYISSLPDMSGVADVSSGLARLPRRCAEPHHAEPDRADAADASLLATLGQRRRITKSGMPFSSLKLNEKQELYQKAADHVSQCETGNLSGMQAARRVASQFAIIINKSDEAAIKASVHNRGREGREGCQG